MYDHSIILLLTASHLLPTMIDKPPYYKL